MTWKPRRGFCCDANRPANSRLRQKARMGLTARRSVALYSLVGMRSGAPESGTVSMSAPQLKRLPSTTMTVLIATLIATLLTRGSRIISVLLPVIACEREL